jgi:hypothetical protein
MSTPSGKTAPRQNFINGDPFIEAKCIIPPNSSYITSFPYPFAGGTKWVELPTSASSSHSTSITWIFNQGGYLNASALGLSSAYQADFNIEPLLRNNGGTIQYFDPVTVSWINV